MKARVECAVCGAARLCADKEGDMRRWRSKARKGRAALICPDCAALWQPARDGWLDPPEATAVALLAEIYKANQKRRIP